MPNIENLVTVAEAAERLGVDVRTVHRRIRTGVLRADKLPGKRGAYLLAREDVEALLASRRPGAGP